MEQGRYAEDRLPGAAEQDHSIAVIGIGCWYPGAKGAAQLWENVLGRRREFRRFPDTRLPVGEYYDPDRSAPDKLYVDRAAFIDGLAFDWAHRRIPKSAYESTDIVQWLAVEVAEQALADAGYQRNAMPKDRTGVIVGNSLTGEQSRASTMRLRWPYVSKVLRKAAGLADISLPQLSQLTSVMETIYKSAFPPVTEDTLQGGLSNTIAGRVCNYFDLHGGGYVVDGACSSSLLAVCTAASYLANGDLDIALAGGVDVSLDTFELVGFAKTGALAANEAGDINVYDRRGAGFLPGEGCGFVVLKRLADARADGDTVYAVIKGWGISSDGKGGITAPSSDGQALALSRAYQRARYSPHELDFIEGHGTGTAVGDRTELLGIAKAMDSFGEVEARSCGVTSFKSIVGHTKAAAGVGAFIKAAMAVNRRVLPPTAGYQEPNPAFESDARALFPVKYGEVYGREKVVRAGVSAMGFGGINSHVTLESGDQPSAKIAPGLDERALLVNAQDCEVFVAGADSVDALLRHVTALEAEAGELSVGDLTDLAARLAQQCLHAAKVRAAVIASTPAELKVKLITLSERLSAASSGATYDANTRGDGVWWSVNATAPRIGFLFPGQGSQQLAMARVLIERFPWARRMMAMADRAAEELLGKPISPLLYADLDRAVLADERKSRMRVLADTAVAQPAICLASLLYARYLGELGITPHLAAGHSLGELTAFQVAGAIDEEALMRLALIRGRAMAGASDAEGAMASLACGADQAKSILSDVNGYAVVANINAPNQTVISGEAAAIDQAVVLGEQAGLSCTRLRVSGAFHSRLVENAASRLSVEAGLPGNLEALDCLLVSGIDGVFVRPGLDLKVHFSTQLLSQVNFSRLVESASGECDLLLEVGPGRVLSSLVARNVEPSSIVCLPVASDPDSTRDLNVCLAHAYVMGAQVKWDALYGQRLVRPYKPASERLFLDNPCERPTAEVVNLTAVDPSEGAVFGSEKQAIPANEFDIDEDDFRAYLKERGNLIGQMSRDVPPAGGVAEPSTEWSAGQAEVRQGANSSADIDGGARDGEISALLISLIASRTGFPAESISMDARLLDDLNLDSIKAGELVAEAAKQCGRVGEVDPSSLANASLSTIAAALSAGNEADAVADSSIHGVETTVLADFRKAAPSSSGSAGKVISANDDLTAMLIGLTSDATGFPEASITSELRLLDDLNLDSIKAGELISTAAGQLNVSGTVDVASLANSRLSEIARALSEAKGVTELSMGVGQPLNDEGATAAAPLEDEEGRDDATARPEELLSSDPTERHIGGDAWVRDFVMTSIAEPLERSHVFPDWSGTRLVVIGEDAYRALTQDVRSHFERLGSRTTYVDFASLINGTASLAAGTTHLLTLLPSHPGVHGGALAEIARAVERLTAITDAVSASGANRLLIAQFAGGKFGQQPDDVVGVEVACAVGFASTLWLERPESHIRVVDLSTLLESDVIPELLQRELETEGPFSIAGYDENRQRYVPRADVRHPNRYADRTLTWTNKDVVLVTGGAKGITAECALAFAEQTGARFALVGSSPLEREAGGDSEIRHNLDRFKQTGVSCKYYSCDISDPDLVSGLVVSVRDDLGPITAVIHGAGINRPRPAAQVSMVEALREVAPKLAGAVNICQALKDSPLKIILAMSSIIGITGMRGNAWYAFSNEALDLALRRFAAKSPDTSVVSLAYSVWGEVGMGHRLGVVKNLKQVGVGAIPTTEGVRRFLRHMNADSGYRQVIIAGPLGGLPTWRALRKRLGSFEDMRFIDALIDVEPGVEMTASCLLTLDRDLYLKDHNFHGSFLFPTVFGLEAMSQSASVLTGANPSSIVGFEDIALERPIAVREGSGCEIRLCAFAGEQDERGVQRVRVAVRTEQSGFKQDHFSATVLFGEPSVGPVQLPITREGSLGLDPKRDLYGGILFQGPLFQRLGSVYALEKDLVVFSGESREGLFDSENGFAAGEGGSLIAGDPFFRDVLLQSVQLSLVPEVVLPIGIGAIDRFSEPDYENGSRVATATLNTRDGRDSSWDVVVANEAGHVVEVLRDYRVRVLDRYRIDSTKITEAQASRSGLEALERTVMTALDRILRAAPTVRLYDLPQLHSLGKSDRHELERPLVDETVRAWMEKQAVTVEPYELTWTQFGKPCLSGEWVGDADLSLAHDEGICLCIVGRGRQGCDIEPVAARSRDEWRGLLGNDRMSLLEALERRGDAQDVAGIRIWCVTEAARKAFAGADVRIEMGSDTDGMVVFDAAGDGGTAIVVSGLFEGESHRSRMIAIATSDVVAAPGWRDSPATVDVSMTDDAFYLEEHASRMVRDPVLEQEVFEYIFQPTFKESANLSRTIFYTSYLAWIGKVRELFMAEIGRELVTQIATGEWGLVTNWADVRISSEASAYDRVVARFRLGRLVGSVIPLHCDFYKLTDHGMGALLARVDQETTWVEVVGHGLVRPAPFPQYFSEFLTRTQQSDGHRSMSKVSNSEFSSVEVAVNLFSGSGPAGNLPLLHSIDHSCTLEDANLVGNVYYANYFIWQGRVRDQFLFSLAPEYFKGIGVEGELLCVHSHLDYLRDAMPFDELTISMHLGSLSDIGAELEFEYHRLLQPGGFRQKLAVGTQRVVWVIRDAEGRAVVSRFPEKIKAALVRHIPSVDGEQRA